MPRGQHGKGYNTAQATPQHNSTIPREVPLPPEKRNKVPEIKAPGVRWYVCTTAPLAEIRAVESLRDTEVGGHKLFRPYAPCEFFWRRSQRGNTKMPLREVQRPCMRHYIFVGIEGGISDEAMAALRARDVEGRNVHGLVSILGSHMMGALPMSDTGLEWLDGLAEAERSGATSMQAAAPFERDDEVRITAGTMMGFVSRVLAVDLEGEQVIVSISLLGAETEMRLPFEHVHKAA